MLEVAMADDKKVGITHNIREKLNFLDERLWKRFLARRLELIDTLDLSSKKASEQEDEIKKVAEILRREFQYGPEYFPDFDKLVRAAVQSVRRNRKRSTKSRRGQVKKGRPSQDLPLSPEGHFSDEADSPGTKTQFLSEISRLSADTHDSVYDMSYSTSKVFTNREHSRAAIDSIIQPVNSESKLPQLSVLLPPLLNLAPNPQQAENEKELQSIRLSLLILIRRSKLCLSLTARVKNEFLRVLGQSAIASVSALVFEHSFSGLNQTSIDYLAEKMGNTDFLARFYRSLDPESSSFSALDDETAVVTLQTLIGCCVKDFGFDGVLYQVGEAFYRSILLEYPLVLKSSIPFRRSQMDRAQNHSPEPQEQTFQKSLTNLAAVATELRSQIPISNPGDEERNPLESKITKNRMPANDNQDRKLVILRFLSSMLEFTYPMKNSAPPRFVELMENAKAAFKLNDNQIFGLRNCSTGDLLNSDFDLERIFNEELKIQLEIFPQRFQAIPIYELTSAVTRNRYMDDSPKIILPPPVKQQSPPALPNPISRPLSTYGRSAILPKFQPLL